MHLGHSVVFYFTDSSGGQRTRRAAIINQPPVGASTTVSLYVFFAPGDRLQGGTQSPNSQVTAIPKSPVWYADDPAAAAAGTPCWSDP